MAARTFEELEVWQKAHRLVLEVYRITAKFPREELFGLSSQLRRAMVSVPANIAEGFVKRGKGDKVRFLNIAQGSLEECRYYFRLAKDLGYVEGEIGRGEIEEISRMLEAYVGAIRRSQFKSWSIVLALVSSGSWLLASGFFR
jgi:four helix bundle protein